MTIEALEGFNEEQLAIINARIAETYVPKTSFDAVKQKADELLSETKAAKKARELAIEEATNAKIADAAKNNDLETYRKSYEEKVSQLTGELEGIKSQNKKQQIKSLANSFVSSKFTNDPLISEAITNKFSSRLDIRDGKEVVLDNDGNLTALSLKDLEAEFLGNDAFKSHIISTRATGSGASGGGQQGGGAAKIITKAEFDAKNPQQKMDYMKSGGKIT
jgi:hypothetical protein